MEKGAKEKLKHVLYEKRLARKNSHVRYQMEQKITEKLKKEGNPDKKLQMQETLELLNNIANREAGDISEYPEYTDNACYGGGSSGAGEN